MRVITIGRGPGNDIVIQDPKVSKIHLQLVFNGNICSAVDLNSTNGTYVNGKKITGEVCLQPNDTIRIGDTMLPWQTYLNTATDSKTVVPSIDASSKHNRRNLWIALSVAIAIILGGAAFGIYYYNQSKEKNEALEKINRDNESRFKQEAEQNEEKRLNEKAEEEQYRQALREDRDANRKLADDKAKEAEEAKAAEEQANKEAEEANAAATKARDEAETAKSDAEKAKQKAESEVGEAKAAELKAKEDEQNAKNEASAAKRSEELMAQFLKECFVMKESFAKEVCNAIERNIPKNTDAKVFLTDIFTKSDNKGKQNIIDAIRKLKSKPDAKGGNDDAKTTDRSNNETTPEEKPSIKE